MNPSTVWVIYFLVSDSFQTQTSNIFAIKGCSENISMFSTAFPAYILEHKVKIQSPINIAMQ